MRRLITADRIHDGKKWLPENAVVEYDTDGTIIAVHDAAASGRAEYLEGAIVPGFVNVHCHLELSHTKGMIGDGTGLIPFLQQVNFNRNDFTEEQKKAARHEAFAEALNNGIVAIGDIANTTDTLDLRSLDRMHFHSFIESIGFTEEFAQQRHQHSVQTYRTFADQKADKHKLRQSIVPHAPYSVSPALFRLIDAEQIPSLLSIHNQESEAEGLFYKDKSGAVNTLLNGFNIDSSFFKPSGRSSLQTYTEYFSELHRFIFVHNTYTSRDDVRFAAARFESIHWCLCPNANRYIEGRLPDILMLREEGQNLCIGTDSLASNHQLSVLAELVSIKEKYPQLGWEELLGWATYNGAVALQMDEVLGSIEAGKKPGLVHLTGLDSGKPVIKRIV